MILVSLCGNMYLVIITEEPSWPWSHGTYAIGDYHTDVASLIPVQGEV